MPFILKAGKALNERKVEIRIQFKPPASDLSLNLNQLRNELVMRVQPDEAIYLKMVGHLHIGLCILQGIFIPSFDLCRLEEAIYLRMVGHLHTGLCFVQAQ